MAEQNKFDEQLQGFAVKDMDALVKKRLESLSLFQRKAGEFVMGKLTAGRNMLAFFGTPRMQAEARKAEKAEQEGWEAFAGKSPSARAAIYEKLYPKIARYIEPGMEVVRRGPVKPDWRFASLRAPNNAALTDAMCRKWILELPTVLGPYDQPLEWYAEWFVHTPMSQWRSRFIAPLFAAAIDSKDETGRKVRAILMESASGTHPVGQMGHHIPIAFLESSDPECWDFIEKMLLAAQRQEGLRQSILECADAAHPQAFRRLLKLVLDHDLSRFSSVTRAMDCWLGFNWDSQDAILTHDTLGRLYAMLEEPARRDEAIKNGSAEDLYLALFAIGFEDVVAAQDIANDRMLNDPSLERRAAALYFRVRAGHPLDADRFIKLLQDKDIRIGCIAAAWINDVAFDEKTMRSLWLERFNQFLRRLPAKLTQLEPLVWPWLKIQANRSLIYHYIIGKADNRLIEDLIGELDSMDSGSRSSLAQRFLYGVESLSESMRAACVRLTGDASKNVREIAFKVFEKHHGIRPQDAPAFENYLRRNADDLRKGAIKLLLQLDDDSVLASADRLRASDNKMQNLAGLELLRQMSAAGRRADECRRRAGQIEASDSNPSEEKSHVAAIVENPHAQWTIDNGFGLYQISDRTVPVQPQKIKNVCVEFKAARACLEDLEQLVVTRLEQIDQLPELDLPAELLDDTALSDEKLDDIEELIQYANNFPSPQYGKPMPLREVWENWFENLPARDNDGMQLIRARWLIHYSHRGIGNKAKQYHDTPSMLKPVHKAAVGDTRYYEPDHGAVWSILDWHIKLHGTEAMADFVLDAIENTFASIPSELLGQYWVDASSYFNPLLSWRDHWSVDNLLKLARSFLELRPDLWTPERKTRLWHLCHWRCWPGASKMKPGEPWWVTKMNLKPGAIPKDQFKQYMEQMGYKNGTYRRRCDTPIELTIEAVQAGEAREADVVAQIIGDSGILDRLSRRDPDKLVQDHPWLKPIVTTICDRILEIEYERGDVETQATELASHIQYLEGRSHFVRLLQALERHSFKRGREYHFWNETSRSGIFSRLLRQCYPAGEDDVDNLGRDLKGAGIKPDRLLEAAMYAPQWAALLEPIIKREGLEDAIWWVWAHLRHPSFDIPKDFQKKWESRVTESTALRPEDLFDGAVDVDWFHRIRAKLDEKQLDKLLKAAKFASDATGHTRATLFAEAMLGRISVDDMAKRALTKRHQDSMRAIGLVPLPEDAAGKTELLNRYETLKEVLRTSRKFGSQRRQNEKRAVETGISNLARTAGFPDPLRLEWAMEYEAVADLAQGPVSVKVNDVEVRLQVDELGMPDIVVMRGEKTLSAVPASMRKKPEVAELTQRKQQLARQHSRMRLSLEEAMCRGDEFTLEEVAGLLRHPILRPMLGDLVFASDMKLGTPAKDGHVLLDAAGNDLKVAAGSKLRIAHPTDLFAGAEWPAWQRDCFVRERIQPFKQIFRELYVVTEAEKQDGKWSHRYAGQQVQPRQAMALLGGRGWVTDGENGVRRTFHQHRISAWLEFQEHFYTPAEVEGLTLEAVHFSPMHSFETIPLADVPARIFSEVMRDVDLAVSVAHRGGVDPEASQSTVEMRAALLAETVAVLGHRNVRVDKNRAFIDGQMGKYSVHLGSGVTHMLPGGSLVIVPVHAQHRGRLFLPFADDDPRTAEILSKILLLADDKKIKDPWLLDQIRAMAK